MSKKLPVTLLVLLAIVQLAVPGSMILRYETTLSKGTALKFRTGIHDPYDPFRGRYLRLDFELSSPTSPEDIALDPSWDTSRYHRQQAYVHFAPDENGFAQVVAITLDKPDTSDLWLRAMVSSNLSRDRQRIWIRFPFDQYFMNEAAAPEAERLYLQANRADDSTDDQTPWNDDNYALVYIRRGTAAIQALIVEGQPIEELLIDEPQALVAP